MDQPIFFGECPVCRQGQLVAVKTPEHGQILLMCDECESQWDTPTLAQSYQNARTEEVYDVVNADLDDVVAAGWSIVSGC